MNDKFREHLDGLEHHLRSRLRGQEHVLPAAAAAFHRGELGLAASDRPKSSFLLVGPTGTGKTELMLCCGEYLFGAGQVCRFDLSDYARADAVELFLGSNADDCGAFGRAMRGRTRGILLFDELEKAHTRLWDLFLQLLDPGHVTVATGERMSTAGFYIAFSSNLGGAESMRMEHSRFASVEQTVLRLVNQTLRPEFVGRIEEKWVFRRLSPEVQREICALRVADETARLRGLGYDVSVSCEALEFLVREGFHPHFGARPLRQAVEKHLRNAVVRELFARGTCRGTLTVNETGRSLSVR